MQKHLVNLIGYAAAAVIVALIIVLVVRYLNIGKHISDSILAAVLTALLIIILSSRMSTI